MDGTRLITAGRFIDGSGADVRRNVLLTVEDGVITTIGSTADIPRGSESEIDDLTHCTILPALVDCSVSLSQSSSIDQKPHISPEEPSPVKKVAMLERHIRYCHSHGVLGVADSSDLSGLEEHFQDRMEQGNIIDIRTSGRLCRSRQDCASENLAGCDFLKIGYSNNIEDEEIQNHPLNHEDLHLILRDKAKKKVVVANGRQQVKEAIEAGCDAIEQGYGMGEDNLRKMAENNILWIPSIVRAKNALDGSGSGGEICCRFSLRYVAPGKAAPGDEAFWKKMLSDQLAQLRFARKIGVTTAVGTGAGSVGILHGESMSEEIKLFLKAGYSLEETIRCASENGARFFDMEKLGTLAVGRRAIFLIVRGTMKQLPRKLSYLEGIYVDGAPSNTYRKM